MSSCRIAVATPVTPHIVGFTQFLKERGYAPFTVGERVRAAEHLGRWMERTDLKLEDLAETETIDSFGRHFAKCRTTIQPRGCKRSKAGANLFVEYARSNPSTDTQPGPLPLSRPAHRRTQVAFGAQP